jgi:hypothetical protein
MMKTNGMFQNRSRTITLVNKGLLVLLALYFILVPALTVIVDLTDPGLRNGKIPRSAVYLFQKLTPRYEKWARARIASGQAGSLTGADISGTEWPPFGSAFYLWAVESLQKEWEAGDHFMAQAPKEYAKDAVEASTALILDPNTAGWVKDYWGSNYLTREDIFYRMLMISAATLYQQFTGDERYKPVLRDQVESLSLEVDQSPFGLLDDYPNQCFPADVVAAVANIQKADGLLGTNHSAFVRRAARGFQGRLADERGLPPYMADSKRGVLWGPSRGCSNSYVCLFASQAWPDLGEKFYVSYEKYFWQEKWGGAGFREFPNNLRSADWYWDVDSGPVLAGHGISASAFGLGAARLHGRMDHAFALASEVLAFSWPLPDGTLLFPRLLSDTTDAPLVGEASLLFSLTRVPIAGIEVNRGGNLPPLVYLVLFAALALSYFLLKWGFGGLRRSWTTMDKKLTPYPMVHCLIWAILVFFSVFGLWSGHLVLGLAGCGVAQFFPLKVTKGKVFV